MEEAVLANVAERKTSFNVKLCLICEQTKYANNKHKEIPLVKLPTDEALQRIIDSKTVINDLRDLEGKTIENILQDKYSYHSECPKVHAKQAARQKSRKIEAKDDQNEAGCSGLVVSPVKRL
jgi:hypothetical protein